MYFASIGTTEILTIAVIAAVVYFLVMRGKSG